MASIFYYSVLYSKHRKLKKKHSVTEKQVDGTLKVTDALVSLLSNDNTNGNTNDNHTVVVAKSRHKELIQKAHDNEWKLDDCCIVGHFQVEMQSARRGESSSSCAPLVPVSGDKGVAHHKPVVVVRKSRLPLQSRSSSLGSCQQKGSSVKSLYKKSTPLQHCNGGARPAGVVNRNQLLHHQSKQQQQQPIRRPLATNKKRPLLKKSSLGGVPFKKPNNSNMSTQKEVLQTQSNNNNNSRTTTTTTLPHLDIPHSIRSSLRPHQVQGVDFVAGRILAGQGAILADEMGLGKTLMTIAVITALYRRQREKHFLVVCPSSLVANWAQEFDKWIGKACQPKRVVISSGGADAEQNIRSFGRSRTGQVLVVSYDLFRRHVALLYPANVGMIIVDEGHRLKNKNGSQTLSALNSIRTDTRLLLTATPMQNCMSEFYALANFACPGQLGSHDEFAQRFSRPIVTANRKDASRQARQEGKESAQELENITQSFMLRRLQSEVLKSMLPPRHEMLVFVRPAAAQRQAYNDIISAAPPSLAALTQLRKVCAQPPDVTNFYSSSKFQFLQTLLDSIQEEAPTDKVVLVSNFTSTLDCVQKLVLMMKQKKNQNNISFVRLDGSVNASQRQVIVDSFHNVSRNKYLLLSSKAGGCGLNLVGSNRIILLDADWNPASDIQAMGRVYRQGQKKECFVYRLFTSGTVEEVVYQRQVQKGSLASLANGKDGSSSFTPEELADCFTLHEESNCETAKKLQWPAFEGAQALEACRDPPLIKAYQNSQGIVGYVYVVPECEHQLASPRLESSPDRDMQHPTETKSPLTSEEEFDGYEE